MKSSSYRQVHFLLSCRWLKTKIKCLFLTLLAGLPLHIWEALWNEDAYVLACTSTGSCFTPSATSNMLCFLPSGVLPATAPMDGYGGGYWCTRTVNQTLTRVTCHQSNPIGTATGKAHLAGQMIPSALFIFSLRNIYARWHQINNFSGNPFLYFLLNFLASLSFNVNCIHWK